MPCITLANLHYEKVWKFINSHFLTTAAGRSACTKRGLICFILDLTKSSNMSISLSQRWAQSTDVTLSTEITFKAAFKAVSRSMRC